MVTRIRESVQLHSSIYVVKSTKHLQAAYRKLLWRKKDAENRKVIDISELKKVVRLWTGALGHANKQKTSVITNINEINHPLLQIECTSNFSEEKCNGCKGLVVWRHLESD